MADKFVVVWGRKSQSEIRLIAIDDQNFHDTVESAKEAGRSLLSSLKMTDLSPVGVLTLSEDAVMELVTSDREVHSFANPDPAATSDEVEMIQLAP